MKRRSTVCLSLLMLAIVSAGCGSDGSQQTVSVDAGQPLASGVAQRVEGTVLPLEGGSSERGVLVLDIFHGDRAVNLKVKVVVRQDGPQGNVVQTIEGNAAIPLPPGLYFASIKYQEAEDLEAFEATVSGLKVNGGMTSRYHVTLRAPIGRLQFRFSKTDRRGGDPLDVGAEVRIRVLGGDRGDALVWDGPGNQSMVLPEGTYSVEARYRPDDGPELVEWYRDLVVEGGLSNTKKEVLFDLPASGVRVDVFNFSQGVNETSTVYFFNPGADASKAVAKASGQAGTYIQVARGTYDLLTVYEASEDLRVDHVQPNFEVGPGGALRLQVDMERPMAVLELKVVDGLEDVSEQVELKVKPAADPRGPSRAVVDVAGVGTHRVEAGTYDITLSYQPHAGERRTEVFSDVALGNGYIWRQSFDLAQGTWQAKPAAVPLLPPRPIGWAEPLEAAASDDDDSAHPDSEDSADPKAAAQPSP